MPAFTACCAVPLKSKIRHNGASFQPQISKQLAAFGANLRRERVSRNITQERLAELVHLNPRGFKRSKLARRTFSSQLRSVSNGALKCPWESLMPS